MRTFLKIFLVSECFLSTCLYSISFTNLLDKLKSKQFSTLNIFRDPFSNIRKKSTENSSFQLFNDGKKSLHKSIIYSLQTDYGLSSMIEVVSDPTASKLGLHSHSEIKSQGFRLKYQGYLFCDYHIKAFQVDIEDHQTGFIGSMPLLMEEDLPEDIVWEDFQNILQILDEYLAHFEEISFDSYHVLNKQKCLRVADYSVKPIWELLVSLGEDLSYMIRIDDQEVISAVPRFFSMDHSVSSTSYALSGETENSCSINDKSVSCSAKTRVYHNNHTTELQDYKVHLETNLNPKGLVCLENKYFSSKPLIEIPICIPPDSPVFEHLPEDIPFAEIFVFTHINEMLKWFQNLGYQWSNASKINLRVHYIASDDSLNQASYIPSTDEKSRATIVIGDGDEIILQNLTTDSDVVNHEFGHHIVFRTLQSFANIETLILHEALADIFTILYNIENGYKDGCFARTICPDSSDMCYVMNTKKRCLRSSDNNLIYNTKNYNELDKKYHLKSQVISGTIFDLYKEGKIETKKLKKIVFQSIDYMVKNSGFSDFIHALLLANKELFGQQNSCNITEAFNKRGFSSLTSKIDCHNIDSLKPSNEQNEPSTDKNSSNETDYHESTGWGWCSVVEKHRKDKPDRQSIIFLMIFLGIPMIVFFQKPMTK